MFEDVYLVDDELQIIDDAAIVAAEEQLGMTLPRGYHAYLTVLGRGTYCDQIYVFPPDKIELETVELRETLRDYFFWDGGIDILPKSLIEQSLLIARSLDGDALIYHPESTYGVYVLPRDDDTIYWLTPEFEDPLAWHSDSGSPMPQPSFRYFEPSRGRCCIELFTARYDHDIKTVANRITAALAGDAETRSIIEDDYELHFHKAVGSRVQLTAAFDGRIGIRIDYNPSHEHAIVACVTQLESDGFYETGRHAT